MTKHREASCACGQLRLTCQNEPIRISICHCLDCQKRTGSVFGAQARFRRTDVTRIEGTSTAFTRQGDSGGTVTFHFCPRCGSTVYWELSGVPEAYAVAIGAFADPHFPSPRVSVYEERRHDWVDLGDLTGLERLG
ncbi:MAG TPA: GFA family protein [Nordella sp.]|nr:GFA family protein [Nordella sp.]